MLPTTSDGAARSVSTTTTTNGRSSPCRATGATSQPFADNDDSLIYRKRFDLTPAPEGRRHFVTLDGVFYQADVWLDGAYLGDPEGYFFPHSFDITSLSRLATEHVLAVEVACPPQRNRKTKRTITGVFQNWDAMDPTWNPGGLWRPVRIDTTGPVRIDRWRVLCRDVNDTALTCDCTLDSTATRHGPCGSPRESTGCCTTNTSSRWQEASTRSTGTSTSTIRGCGGRGRSATRS